MATKRGAQGARSKGGTPCPAMQSVAARGWRWPVWSWPEARWLWRSARSRPMTWALSPCRRRRSRRRQRLPIRRRPLFLVQPVTSACSTTTACFASVVSGSAEPTMGAVGKRDDGPVGLDVTTPVFVGREAELARFQRALGLAASGTPVVTLVAGEAGVGKTRLVSEVAAVARRKRFEVCVGRCLDLGPVNWPLAPWRGIVGAPSTALDDEGRDLGLGGARGA